ncbi:MAG: BRO family protein [Bilophila wadsworthia]
MSGLRIFQNRDFGAVRVIEHKGEPWFVARDVCAVLGTETRDLPDILEHDEQRPIVDIIHTLNDSTGLRRDSRIISEPGLYSLVLRSRKPEAKAFKRWIVHEVIPSIRRTGGYGAPALPNFRNPAEAARAWADREQRLRRAEGPGAGAEDGGSEAQGGLRRVIEVAKTSISWGNGEAHQDTGYDIGQNRFRVAQEQGYLRDGSQTNMPTQRSMDAGWMEIKEGTGMEAVGKAASPARRKSRARGKSIINLFKKMVES